MSEVDAFLRELHHRVKNNFQIIASLMNLQKRLLPADRQNDLRFIEEHVQSMAVAYRVVYATIDLVSVSVYELVREVADGLQHIAKCPKSLLQVEITALDQVIGLNQAVALSLYLAVVLPPYLDRAMALGTAPARLRLDAEANHLVLICSGDWQEEVELEFLRTRLVEAYLRQLNAEVLADLPPPARGIKFLLEPLRPGLI